jgi:hypothetical protein
MPASFHVVSPGVWDRSLRSVSTTAQVVAFYVWTCRLRSSEGLFELAAGHVVVDTGLGEDQVLAALEELEHVGLVSYDVEAEIVLDRRALRDNPLKNGIHRSGPKAGEVAPDNRIKGAVTRFAQMPDTPLKVEFLRLALRHSEDLALAIGQGHPDLYTAASLNEEGASKGLAVEGASKGLARGPTSRGEPRRVESVRAEGETVPPCGHCQAEAAAVTAGQIQQRDGRPWCGWCNVPQAVGS